MATSSIVSSLAECCLEKRTYLHMAFPLHGMPEICEEAVCLRYSLTVLQHWIQISLRRSCIFSNQGIKILFITTVCAVLSCRACHSLTVDKQLGINNKRHKYCFRFYIEQVIQAYNYHYKYNSSSNSLVIFVSIIHDTRLKYST